MPERNRSHTQISPKASLGSVPCARMLISPLYAYKPPVNVNTFVLKIKPSVNTVSPFLSSRSACLVVDSAWLVRGCVQARTVVKTEPSAS